MGFRTYFTFMSLFLVLLLIGFILCSISASTKTFSQRWGALGATYTVVFLRDFLGIPAWVIGLILAFRLEYQLLIHPSGLTIFLGWVVILVGAVPGIWGLLVIRKRSYAASIHDTPSIHDTLDARGPYAFIRHPIYSGLALQLLGLLFLRPTLPALLASLLTTGWINVQARLEERDLASRMPAYRVYMRRVPRFIPKLRQ